MDERGTTVAPPGPSVATDPAAGPTTEIDTLSGPRTVAVAAPTCRPRRSTDELLLDDDDSDCDWLELEWLDDDDVDDPEDAELWLDGDDSELADDPLEALDCEDAELLDDELDVDEALLAD